MEQNIFNPLKETNLYKQVSVEDKIKLATVNVKVYNQNEFLGSKILTGLQHNRYKNIQEITEMVDGFIKNKNNKPDYLESGYKHALKGANVITELIKANPSNPLFQAWEKISENPLANPNSFTGSQREDYLEIKHLFLNSDKAGKIIREHNMQPQLSPKQEKSLEKAKVDITRPWPKTHPSKSTTIMLSPPCCRMTTTKCTPHWTACSLPTLGAARSRKPPHCMNGRSGRKSRGWNRCSTMRP